MKVGDYKCARCGRKGTLSRKGQTVFQCSYCGAPYIIEGIPTETQPQKTQTQEEKMIAARRRLEALRNKKIEDPSKRRTVALNEKLRDVEELAAWAGIPMPKHIHGTANPAKMFEKCSLHGLKLIDNETGKTLFDFGQAREHSSKLLWGLDEKQYRLGV